MSQTRFLTKPSSAYILLLISVTALAGIGLIMVLSASSITSYETTGDTYSIFIKQVLFTCIGLLGLFLVSRPKTKIWDLLIKHSYYIDPHLLISYLTNQVEHQFHLVFVLQFQIVVYFLQYTQQYHLPQLYRVI